MPPIVLAAFGFTAGLVAGLSLAQAWIAVPLCAAAAALLWRRRPLAAAWPLVLAAGLVYGLAARRGRDADCRVRWAEGERLALVIEPRERPGEGRVRRYEVSAPEACAGAIAVEPLPGDTALDVRVVTGVWRRDGAAAEAWPPRRPERAGRLVVRTSRRLDRPGRLRNRIRLAAEARLARLFGSRWALAAALTVSPEAALPRAVRRRFATAGLAHILAISGFHVGILAGALILLLRAARLTPDRARIAGTLLVAAYVWLLGAPAPALRAALSLGLWTWARARQRPPVPAGLLASAALGILAVEPWAVFEAGPWLSFAGVLGCAAASRWWGRVVREGGSAAARRRLRLAAPVAVSAGAVLATSPIQLIAFGTASPVAVLTNIAAVPAAACAVPALALALALASLPVPGALAVAAYPAAASGLALDVLDAIAAWGESLSWGTLAPAAPPAAAVVATLLALWMLRPGPRRRPARAVLASRVLVAGSACAAFALWWPVLAWSGADEDGRLALHFLAVGQGDAAAIRTPHGAWIVIDGGPRGMGGDAGAAYVLPFLRRAGARRLAVVVATHGDADHMGGLPTVLAALPADVALEPGIPLGLPLYADWLHGIAHDGARWHAARAGERFTLDGVTVRVWNPDSASLASGWELNDNSVVLTVEYGAFRSVFTGDAGLPMEAVRAAGIGRAAVLKVAHHGSRSGSGAAWLAALHPAVCLIGVGRNRYGHPDPGVVQRLADAGCGVWRTDRDGDVTTVTDGRRVTVRAAGRDTTFIVSQEQP